MTDEEIAPESAALIAAVQPIVHAAIEAEMRGDRAAVCEQVGELFERPTLQIFAASLRLAQIAALRVRPKGSREEYFPLYIDARTGQRYDPDLPKNAAHTFAARFAVAAVNEDRERQRALWIAMAEPACGPDPDPVAVAVVLEAVRLLVGSAALGLRREAAARREAEHRKHQHPKASRNGRPHRRDQRKH
jgi:hypothetical protein